MNQLDVIADWWCGRSPAAGYDYAGNATVAVTESTPPYVLDSIQQCGVEAGLVSPTVCLSRGRRLSFLLVIAAVVGAILSVLLGWLLAPSSPDVGFIPMTACLVAALWASRDPSIALLELCQDQRPAPDNRSRLLNGLPNFIGILVGTGLAYGLGLEPYYLPTATHQVVVTDIIEGVAAGFVLGYAIWSAIRLVPKLSRIVRSRRESPPKWRLFVFSAAFQAILYAWMFGVELPAVLGVDDQPEWARTRVQISQVHHDAVIHLSKVTSVLAPALAVWLVLGCLRAWLLWRTGDLAKRGPEPAL